MILDKTADTGYWIKSTIQYPASSNHPKADDLNFKNWAIVSQESLLQMF
jgi:hypothetical protein